MGPKTEAGFSQLPDCASPHWLYRIHVFFLILTSAVQAEVLITSLFFLSPLITKYVMPADLYMAYYKGLLIRFPASKFLPSLTVFCNFKIWPHLTSDVVSLPILQPPLTVNWMLIAWQELLEPVHAHSNLTYAYLLPPCLSLQPHRNTGATLIECFLCARYYVQSSSHSSQSCWVECYHIIPFTRWEDWDPQGSSDLHWCTQLVSDWSQNLCFHPRSPHLVFSR